MNRRKIIFIFLSLVWMAVIFAFSSRDGEKSTRDSHKVGFVIGRVIIHAFEEKSGEEQLAFAEDIDHVIRKLAHGMEYAVLGILLSGAFISAGKKNRWYIPWGISVLYAVTDEIHQVFVPGRDGNVIDVCIDSTGALFGCLIFWIFLNCKKNVM